MKASFSFVAKSELLKGDGLVLALKGLLLFLYETKQVERNECKQYKVTIEEPPKTRDSETGNH